MIFAANAHVAPATSSSVVECFENSCRSPYDPKIFASADSRLLLSQTATSRSGSRYGRGFRRTPSMTLNTAVFAPIASVRVRITVAANPGAFRNVRQAYRASSPASTAYVHSLMVCVYVELTDSSQHPHPAIHALKIEPVDILFCEDERFPEHHFVAVNFDLSQPPRVHRCIAYF